ncbi:MAG: hypothetical protein HUU50_11690 [Candidatus Brocadiae bacterium]|nr:hypothetical protein [Candidatus Brocadiia bacterium]
MKCFLSILFFLCLAIVLKAGPISDYYVTGWVNQGIYALQGNAIKNSWANAGSYELAIVVDDRVRTYSHNVGYNGAEYTLSGSFTGKTYVNNLGANAHDATTDGTYYYLFSHGAQTIYKFEKDWQNPQVLFSFTGAARLGITYDPTDNTLWISGWGTGLVEHYTMSGGLLGSFATDTYTSALALDHADGTLWLSSGATNTFKQYSKSGTLLSTVTYSAVTGNIYGGEFAFIIPESNSLFFIFGALIAFFLKK